MKEKEHTLISFDWAMNSILKQKSNFEILEGLFSTILKEDIKIDSIIDTESNKEHSDDKYTRTDIQVKNKNGNIFIVEVQCIYDIYNPHKVIYGGAIAIKEILKKNNRYDNVKKIVSITIAYGDLGEGSDYVYKDGIHFYGIHDKKELDTEETKKYNKPEPKQVFPEHWIIRLSEYKDQLKNELDQWIYFLKNDSIKKDFKAKGLQEAAKKTGSIKNFWKEIDGLNQYEKFLLDRNSGSL